MKLVVGLGNPGGRYERSRHNLGFRVLDALADRWRIDLSRQRFEGLTGDGLIAGQPTLLLKPLTFMNLSGRSVQAAVAFYKLPTDAMLVVVDDMDLPVGRLRLRASGSPGGHRGLEDISRRLGTGQYARLRIGIGRPRQEAVSHVLSGFAPEEEPLIATAIQRAADAVECWLQAGIAEAMNRFNRADAQSDGGPETTDKGVAP